MTVLTATDPETVVAGQIVDLEREAWAMEVAHTRDREHYEKFARRLSLGVMALSTVVGSSIIVSIGQSSNTYVKAIVGVASLLVAVLAGINQKGPYVDLRAKLRVKAEMFARVHEDVSNLRRHFILGETNIDAAKAALEQYGAAYEAAKKGPLDLRDYPGARTWVNMELRIKAQTEAQGH